MGLKEVDPADTEFHPNKGRRGVIYGYVTTPDDEGKPMGQLKYYDIWSGFRERTTAHGPTHISSARGPVKKVLWILVVLILFGVAINSLREIIIVYISRPVDVVTKLDRKSDIPFPAVTFCNLNPTRNSMLVESQALRDALDVGEHAADVTSENKETEPQHSREKRQAEGDEGDEEDTKLRNAFSHKQRLNYEGCYIDTEDHDIAGRWHRDANQTVVRCADMCHSNVNYQAQDSMVIGLQNSDDCYCGDGFGKHGEADESECNMACTGASKQKCGGPSRNSVYTLKNQNVTEYSCDNECICCRCQEREEVDMMIEIDTNRWKCGAHCKNQCWPYQTCVCGVCDSNGPCNNEGKNCTNRCLNKMRAYRGDREPEPEVEQETVITGSIHVHPGITDRPYIRNEVVTISCQVTSMKISQKSFGFGVTVHDDGEEPYDTGCIYMWTTRGAYIALQYVTGAEPTQQQCDDFYTSLLQTNTSTLQVTIKLKTTGTYQCLGWTEDTLIPFGLVISMPNLQEITDATTTMPATRTTTTKTPQEIAGREARIEDALNIGVADKQLGQITAEYKVSQNFKEVLAAAPPEELKLLGHQLKDFILGCSYRGRKCKDISAMFTPTFNPVYGNCYTFNSGIRKDSVEPLKAYKSGRQYGLSLTLNLEAEEYIAKISESAGVRVLIHNRMKMPFVEDEGFSLPPGRDISVGVKKLSIERLEHPYSDCMVNLQNQQDIDVYQEKYGTNYSTKACEKTCYQRAVISQCGCTDALYPLTGKALRIPDRLRKHGMRVCSTIQLEDVRCLARVASDFEVDKLDCSQCKNPCSEDAYQVSLSGSYWPTEAVLSRTKNRLSKLGATAQKTINSNETSFRENFLKVSIFYQDLNMQSYSERASLTFDVMMSNLGGALGLYIGMSFITICEVGELLFDLVMLAIHKMKRRTRSRQSAKLPVENAATTSI